MTQALTDKNKEALTAAIERIEREGITIDPKQLNDAKNALSKMKWSLRSYIAKVVISTLKFHIMFQMHKN